MSFYILVYLVTYLHIISPHSLLKSLMWIFPNRSPLKSELSDESDSNRNLRQASRKKKKEKKKKRKHQHHKKTKRKRGQSSSSGSEPDTDSEKDKSPRGLRGGNRGPETLRSVSRLNTCDLLDL